MERKKTTNKYFRICLSLLLLIIFLISPFSAQAGKLEGKGEIKITAPDKIESEENKQPAVNQANQTQEKQDFAKEIIEGVKDLFQNKQEEAKEEDKKESKPSEPKISPKEELKTKPPKPSVKVWLKYPTKEETLYWSEKTIPFRGTATAGAEIRIGYKNELVARTLVNANGKWEAGRVPLSAGENCYTLIGIKNGHKNTEVTTCFYTANFWEKYAQKPAGKIKETTHWRTYIGEPENIEEFAGSTALDFIVIGDARDIGKEMYYLATGNPKFSDTTLALSFVGIATTLQPEFDVLASSAKSLVKITKKVALEYPVLADFVLKSAKNSAKIFDIKGLSSLSDFCLNVLKKGGKGSDTLKTFDNFAAFKQYFGPAGKGYEWHHIVEQHSGNIKKFGDHAIHNSGNIIKVPAAINRKINGYYLTKRFEFTSGKSVREWLQNKSFEEQYEFGLKVLQTFLEQQ